MDLKSIKERAKKSLGITELLPMQQQMAKLSLPARVLLQAPTGSGKTLAFAIAMLRALPSGFAGIKAVVIAPTRELVLQIYDTVRPLAAPDFKTAVCYGGHSYESEAKSLDGNPDIVIGTPGRLLDHINRGRLSLKDTRTLVIDEYDKSLELGFAPDMKRIVDTMRHVRTLILTSATAGEVPAFVGAVEHTFDYRENKTEHDAPIISYRIDSPSPDKLETLIELLRTLSSRKTIVFVNHREAAERVYKAVQEAGIDACLYHGGLEQQYRERALILFDNGTCPVMIATDLAARGLDIADVDAVVHYHLPSSVQAWTHRNGRTGRLGGTAGSAYVIVSAKETVPEYISTETFEAPAPLAEDITQKATLYFNAGKKDKISRGDIAGFLIAKGGLDAGEVGRIDVRDHSAYVAIPADKVKATLANLAPHKIKNTRVKVTQVKN